MSLIEWFLLTCMINSDSRLANIILNIPSWERSHIPLQGSFESMSFLFPFGGICDRSLEGMQTPPESDLSKRHFVTWLFFGKPLNLVVFNEKTRWTPAHHPSKMPIFTRETDTNLNQHFLGGGQPQFQQQSSFGGMVAQFFWVRPTHQKITPHWGDSKHWGCGRQSFQTSVEVRFDLLDLSRMDLGRSLNFHSPKKIGVVIVNVGFQVGLGGWVLRW